MRYKFVAFDLDGVLVDIESSWDWIHKYFGVDNDESLRAYMRGEIDDNEFMKRDIALWREKKEKMNIREIKKILSTAPIMKGTRQTIQKLRKGGIETGIVSGGLDILGEMVAKKIGIDYVVANGLGIDKDGCLLGDGILNVELMNKGRALSSLLKKVGTRPGECVSIGNSFVDVSMFQVSGLGIAFNPQDNIVREKADIVIQDKDLRKILRHII